MTDHLKQARWFSAHGRHDKDLLRGQLHALIAIAETLQFPPLRVVMGANEGDK